MRLPFALRHALREARANGRRLGVYLLAISLGVGALVAIRSFRTDALEAVRQEARGLLGADLELHAGAPLPDSVLAAADSLAAEGVELGRVVRLPTVVIGPHDDVRLVQLHGVSGGWPFYGELRTDPPGVWERLEDARVAVVDPALLIHLGAELGDSLEVGGGRFVIGGTFEGLPPDFGPGAALGPRVVVGERWLAETGLLAFGTLARHHLYFRFPNLEGRQPFIDRYHDSWRRANISFGTAEERAENVTEFLDALTRFLGLVGLAALLLGGVGVAVAVHVFVRERRPVIAVLRCIGATQRTAFSAYLLLAVLLGAAGAAAGVLLGLAVRVLLPGVLGELVPVRVGFSVDMAAAAAGLAAGMGVAVIFALLPLLEVRGIAPLRALREDDSERPAGRRLDPARLGVYACLAAVLVALGVWTAPTPLMGWAFAGALVAVLALLRAVAWLLARALRRWFPHGASFVVRQGMAGLFRPHNQTAAVTVALGFGVFAVGGLWLVQQNLLDWILPEDRAARPTLAVIDVQADQRAAVDAIFTAAGLAAPSYEPIVVARIAALDGVPVDSILDGPRAREVEPWALRREYRNTWRARLSDAEELVAGTWFDAEEADLPRISMEEDLAASLGVGLGSTVTWDVQGRNVATRITSLRAVDWSRFGTNYFVVFEPGALAGAPTTYVSLAEVPDANTRARLQRDLTRRHANLGVLDVAVVQEALARVLDRVTGAIRFMALFTLAGGAAVLFGAVAAARHQRSREAVLLRTLGATRAQVTRILLTEYAVLGAMAGSAGVLLASVAGWALVHWVFRLDFHPHPVGMLGLGLAAALLAAAAGALTGRAPLRRPPLAALRDL
ncbi:MAG: FtsX-like permease family protein [Gemmatimonadota bacterium]